MTLPLAVIAAWLAFNALVAWTGLGWIVSPHRSYRPPEITRETLQPR